MSIRCDVVVFIALHVYELSYAGPGRYRFVPDVMGGRHEGSRRLMC